MTDKMPCKLRYTFKVILQHSCRGPKHSTLIGQQFHKATDKDITEQFVPSKEPQL